MADDIAIKVEHVSKDFVLPHEKITSVKGAFTSVFNHNRTKESQHALKDISFEVKKGEFFGIVGRNGSGKSTMLKILANIYQPTKGRMHTEGKLVPFIELGVGFNPELTGRENVFLNGAMLGFSRNEVNAMYDDIVAFAELERFMDKKLKNYSSGMQVRLAFSMATRSEADILLVDEVLAVGDADFQRKCFDYFKTLKKNKKTVVFVTHDMNAVREYCDRAIMIEQSEIVKAGTPEAVATEYTKLFMHTNRVSQTNEVRWGDGVAKYTDVDVKLNTRDPYGAVTITTTLHAYEGIRPIAGFSIKDAAGNTILGTNTRIKKSDIPAMKAGEEVKVIWKVPNVFSDGTLYLNLAATHDNGITECDHWEEAASFIIYKEERTPYSITPDMQVEIKK